MKRMLWISASLCCLGLLCPVGRVLGGPNAGGTLNAHDASLLMSATNGSVSVCGQGSIPGSCDAFDPEIGGSVAADPSVFKVYATFPDGSSPRLMGLTWGVNYPASIVLAAWGMCGNFELNDPTWPSSDTGSSVTYDVPQTGPITAVYWFAAYAYGGIGLFTLRDNPSQGGWFGDDTVPAILDPIAGYGTLGFDMPGTLTCGPPPPLGACCDGDGNCSLTLEQDCPPPDHIWQGPFTICDPNPCSGIYGACCASDCSCTITTESSCPSGIWLGPQTSCDPNPCDCPPPLGACCSGTGDCLMTPEFACDGTWHGEWLTCDPNPCVTPTERITWGRIKANYR